MPVRIDLSSVSSVRMIEVNEDNIACAYIGNMFIPVFSIETNKIIRNYDCSNQMTGIHFTHRKKNVIYAIDDSFGLHVFDTRTDSKKKLRLNPESENHNVSCTALSPNNDILAVASDTFGGGILDVRGSRHRIHHSHVVSLYDIRYAGEPITSYYKRFTDEITGIQYYQNGHDIIVGDKGGGVKAFDTNLRDEDNACKWERWARGPITKVGMINKRIVYTISDRSEVTVFVDAKKQPLETLFGTVKETSDEPITTTSKAFFKKPEWCVGLIKGDNEKFPLIAVHGVEKKNFVSFTPLDQNGVREIAPLISYPGHTGVVKCMTATPNYILTGGDDGKVVIQLANFKDPKFGEDMIDHHRLTLNRGNLAALTDKGAVPSDEGSDNSDSGNKKNSASSSKPNSSASKSKTSSNKSSAVSKPSSDSSKPSTSKQQTSSDESSSSSSSRSSSPTPPPTPPPKTAKSETEKDDKQKQKELKKIEKEKRMLEKREQEKEEKRKAREKKRQEKEEQEKKERLAAKAKKREARERKEQEELDRKRQIKEKKRREREEREEQERRERKIEKERKKKEREAIKLKEKEEQEKEEKLKLEKEQKESEETGHREAEEKKRQELAEKAKKEAEDKAKKETEEKVKKEASEKERKEADEKKRREDKEKERKEAKDKERQAEKEKERQKAQETSDSKDKKDQPTSSRASASTPSSHHSSSRSNETEEQRAARKEKERQRAERKAAERARDPVAFDIEREKRRLAKLAETPEERAARKQKAREEKKRAALEAHAAATAAKRVRVE